MANGTVKVILRLTAQADKVAALRSLLLGLVSPTSREAGCVRYDILQNKADPCEFTLLEEWKTDSALDAHLTTPHVRDAFARGLPLLAQEPDSRRYSTIW